MTTATLTLADFLLARIAEDEASIDEMVRGGDPSWWSADRMLYECEAKRRIVEGRTGIPHPSDGCDGSCDGPNDHWHLVYEWDVLRALAAVYADHPDYREAWKP